MNFTIKKTHPVWVRFYLLFFWVVFYFLVYPLPYFYRFRLKNENFADGFFPVAVNAVWSSLSVVSS